MTNQNTKPADDKATKQPDPKTQKIGDKTGFAQTDEDVQNNPNGPKPLAPNDPEPPYESGPQKQARIARENEKAEGAGLPPVFPHD